jgi:nitrite reductase/ring-hydroxylating ferredoxin subunit
VSTSERLCLAADVAENSLQRITLRENFDICVTRLNGQVYAVVDRCGHLNAPVSQGELDGEVVECPVHHAQFNLITGAVVRQPEVTELKPGAPIPSYKVAWSGGLEEMIRVIRLKRLKVTTKDDFLFVDLPDPE